MRWAQTYDRYVIGVWIGRPDNSAVPGLTGLSTAAPGPQRASGADAAGRSVDVEIVVE